MLIRMYNQTAYRNFKQLRQLFNNQLYNQFFIYNNYMESIVASKDRLHFFQYMEVDILQEYFRTGISYFINAILNAYPSLIGLRYHSLQISTIVDFLKDFYYLTVHKATYAQNFYELERKLGTHSKLIALKSALIWAIIPYISTKMELFYNQIVGDQIDGKKITLLKKIFKTIYPFIYTFVGIIQILYKFRYLYVQKEKDQYYHLLYHLDHAHLGHKERREQAKYPLLELLKKPGILIILMGHKVLTWYFNQKSTRQINKIKDDNCNVQAPTNDEDIDQQGRCPICTKQIKNATMVRTTGYVYCYDCINDYAKRQRKCPMSQLPINESNLQILYN